MKKIKVKIFGEEHSVGRGVGFYRHHLMIALEKSGQIEFVSDEPDVVHYPFFDPFYSSLPKNLNYPTIVTIHDLIPLVLKEYYPLGLRGRLTLWSQVKALNNVAAIITDSFRSKKDIVKILKLDQKKVFVTHLAADEVYSQQPTPAFIASVKQKYHLPDDFILYVGGINPNKNLVCLAKAAISLNIPLVFVGSEFTKEPTKTFSFKKLIGLQTIHPEVNEFNKLKKIIFKNPLFQYLGFVSTEELNAIYRLASLYCQPSIYEGFGLPILQAMMAGCLIVSSDKGSLPEIYSPDTLTIDPTNQLEIEKVLKTALSLPVKEKDRLIVSARQKAREFSWEKTAQLTLEVYKKVIGYN